MAYAAVVLAKQNLLHSSHSNIPNFPRSETEPIHNQLCSLELILATFSSVKGRKLWVGPLISTIKSRKLWPNDDHVSSYGFISESNTEDDSSNNVVLFSQELINVKQEIRSINEKLRKQQATSAEFYQECSNLVGLDFDISYLRQQLDEDRDRRLMIVSIFGMVGIGKTTLVQYICDDAYVCSFETCLMVTLGPNYKQRQFLLLALDHLGLLSPKVCETLGGEELGKCLWKFLKGQRYLIVLDNVWYIEVWEELIKFFLDKRTSSRIILTTRLIWVANHVDGRYAFFMRGYCPRLMTSLVLLSSTYGLQRDSQKQIKAESWNKWDKIT